MAHWVGAQGQVKARKHAPIMTSPTKNTKPETKNFVFQSQLNDLLNP